MKYIGTIVCSSLRFIVLVGLALIARGMYIFELNQHTKYGVETGGASVFLGILWFITLLTMGEFGEESKHPKLDDAIFMSSIIVSIGLFVSGCMY